MILVRICNPPYSDRSDPGLAKAQAAREQQAMNRGEGPGNEKENPRMIQALQDRPRGTTRFQQMIVPALRQQEHDGKTENPRGNHPPGMIPAAEHQQDFQHEKDAGDSRTGQAKYSFIAIERLEPICAIFSRQPPDPCGHLS